ncbi:MAG: hypothetical protein VW835_05940, partial [Rickettsiales bacterium]
MTRVENKSAAGPDKGILNTWFGLNEQPGTGGAGSGLGVSVNAFLWRAALDTISSSTTLCREPLL